MGFLNFRGADDPPEREACSGLWRSEDMKLISIAFERGRIKQDLLALGGLGCAQLCDLNAETQAFSKEYTVDIRRCEELQRKVRFFQDEMKRWAPRGGWRTASVPATSSQEGALDDAERETGTVYPEYDKQNANYQKLRSNWIEAYEFWQVLESHVVRELAVDTQRDDGGLCILAGTIPSAKVATFQRLAYRVTRGYAEVHTTPLPDPSHLANGDAVYAGELFGKEDLDRHIFVGVFHSSAVGQRLKKLAQSMEAHVLMENAMSRADRELQERQQSETCYDCSKMLVRAKESVQQMLAKEVVPNVQNWFHTALVHKAVAHNMNMLQMRPHSAVGVAWVPQSRIEDIKNIFSGTTGAAKTVVMELETPKHVSPPTHFETNKFTECFQGIVSSYGMPRYKEANPAVFTIVTFPWLFGVMYGDTGHGLIIITVAALFILKEKMLGKMALNEMVEMVFGARYLLLLMGLFATYYGLLYNDTFGVMMEYSESSVKWPAPNAAVNPFLSQVPVGCDTASCMVCHDKSAPVYTGGEYGSPTFGIDVAWAGTGRKLEVYNSFKMKSAIVIGVLQMTLGLIIQFFNNKYFKDWKHIYFGFIPEVIFLSCTFGYMSFLIILKWLSPFEDACRVSLLETMVNFFLNPSGIDPQGNSLPELYPGQIGFQKLLLAVALICVLPFMLFPIPYIEWKYHSKPQEDEDGEELTPLREDGADGVVLGVEEDPLVSKLFPPKDGVFDMQEVVIKQIIHAIEFVLGSVSNTASYLRLWALSLAHAQLSDVFLEYLFFLPLEKIGSSAAMYMCFAAWMSATLGILVAMEGLSAFLHALRLHWVEFQNKFYLADGYAFTPLDCEEIIREAEAEAR
eukprot:TRINITY_DN1758_c0_g1_i1.p1 TRINITY_DN1758_c0_g1~~TRINITY_DN1758_c0_g1_i1.p1  ORF type:complete len:854 (+),score=386.93 TRINITY_DN1758_c0_g1_i1:52-2613(+)